MNVWEKGLLRVEGKSTWSATNMLSIRFNV